MRAFPSSGPSITSPGGTGRMFLTVPAHPDSINTVNKVKTHQFLVIALIILSTPVLILIYPC
jgi:hypothetical protein